MPTVKIKLIIHDVRSSHNVGSIFRTADGIGVETIYITGYSPYPLLKNDTRLPHIAIKVDKQIEKTALGSQMSQKWQKRDDIFKLIQSLKNDGWLIVGLEQTKNSISLPGYAPSSKIAVIIGNEVNGIDKELLEICDQVVEIPMQGKKESFNVVQATAMILYHLRFYKQIRL